MEKGFREGLFKKNKRESVLNLYSVKSMYKLYFNGRGDIC